MFMGHLSCADPFLYRIFVFVPENVFCFMDNDFVFKCYTVLESRSALREF
jgi:hypothetical protein